MDDLSLLTLDDLWDEIKKRSDTALLILRSDLDSRRDLIRTRHTGSISDRLGLCQLLKRDLLREVRQME